MTENGNKKKKKTPKYTQFTLGYLRELQYTAEVVERWVKLQPGNPHDRSGYRRDLFHFGDILALRKDVGICAVQSTSSLYHPEHIRKIVAQPEAKLWLKCKGRIMLISWGKKKYLTSKGRMSKAERWYPRCEEITLKDHF